MSALLYREVEHHPTYGGDGLTRRWVLGRKTAQRRVTFTRYTWQPGGDFNEWSLDVTFGFGRWWSHWSVSTGYADRDPLPPYVRKDK
jgi:hypothetical protein